MSQGKILVVDDERNVRLTDRVALETEGYEIVEADGGREALRRLQEQAFDLAICDLRMPGMDGLALLQAMHSLDLFTPVVMITAYGDVSHAVEAMKLGAIDFLQKPIRPEELRAVVKEVIQRHRPPFSLQSQSDFHGHLRAAKRLINLRQFAGAKEHLVKALEINDQAPEALNLSGVLFELQEDFPRAEHFYQEALRIDKRHEGAQANLQRLYELFNFGSSKKPFHLG